MLLRQLLVQMLELLQLLVRMLVQKLEPLQQLE
jgi:hypothetical protein